MTSDPLLTFDEFKERTRAWQAENPDCCGMCFLPDRHCLHRDPTYLEDIRKASITEIRWIEQRGYLRKLNELSKAELMLLPLPWDGTLREFLQDWRRIEPDPPTIWERLVFS